MSAPLIGLLAAIAIPSTPTHFVTDTTGMLSSTAQDAIASELRDFQTKTGDQVIVWIGDTTGATPLEEWTVDAAEKWRVGRKGKDDGAVLFIFREDRKVRIEVGYGLESSLTDARAAEIIRDTIAPEIAAGTPDKAVQDGVDAMLRAIDGDHAPPAPAPSFNLFSAIGHAIGMTMTAFKYVVGGAILLFVLFYFVFGELVTWIRRDKPHGDWMDSFMDPIHSDQAKVKNSVEARAAADMAEVRTAVASRVAGAASAGAAPQAAGEGFVMSVEYPEAAEPVDVSAAV